MIYAWYSPIAGRAGCGVTAVFVAPGALLEAHFFTGDDSQQAWMPADARCLGEVIEYLKEVRADVGDEDQT